MEKSPSPTLTAKVLSVVCEHLNNDTDFRFLKDVVITGIMDEIRDLIRNNAKSIVASVTDAEALREAVKEKEVQIQQLEQTVLELQALQRQMRGSDEDGSSLDVSFTTEENATKKNSKN